jgi:Leucine-rich repeat (LRR) protein
LNNLDGLKRLELRSNRITKIENLNNLKNMKLITLSCNLVTSISEEDVGYWENLEEMGLFGNFLGIENKDSIIEIENKNKEILKTFLNCLSLKSPKLKKIYLGGNHFSKINDYKNLLKKELPNLEYLDGSKI